MADKLAIYNGILILTGCRPLASLREQRNEREALDAGWDDQVAYCLAQGQWNFARRTIEASAADSVEPAFGFTYAFTKPTDFVRLMAIANEDRFLDPLRDYNDEQGYWWANFNPLYVSYVSSDTAYGMDLGKWPASFAEYVKAHTAAVAYWRLIEGKAQNVSIGSLATFYKLAESRLKTARSEDAMNQPSKRPPRGSWSRARSNGRVTNDSSRGLC